MKNLLIVLGVVFGGAQLARLTVPGKYRSLYKDAGARWGVDPNLLHALALQETRENPAAVSPPNANNTRDYGLMQINETNLARYGLTTSSALDPAESVEAAAHLLSDIQARAPQLGLLDLISVYNAGFSDQDADPSTPGMQLRPKLSSIGDYFNAQYVREAWAFYVLVLVGSIAPVPANWS